MKVNCYIPYLLCNFLSGLKSLWCVSSESCCLINCLAVNRLFPSKKLKIVRKFADWHRVSPTQSWLCTHWSACVPDTRPDTDFLCLFHLYSSVCTTYYLSRAHCQELFLMVLYNINSLGTDYTWLRAKQKRIYSYSVNVNSYACELPSKLCWSAGSYAYMSVM